MIDAVTNYTPAEVGAFLRKTAETIQSWCRDNVFPNAFKSGDDEFAHWLIPGQDVLDWIERRKSATRRSGSAA